jgi:hypothetical protein
VPPYGLDAPQTLTPPGRVGTVARMNDARYTFDEILALIRTPKPPLSCKVVELREGVVVRSARVLFDGLEGWFVEDDDQIELRSAHDRALFDTGEGLNA